MTIAACLYHGEVIFPRPDEIVNGRYVRRRPRRPPIVDFSQETNESIITKGLVCKIGQVSRPVSFFRFGPWIDWDYCRMRAHVRDIILGQPENVARTELRRLESELRQCASEYYAASRKLAEFERLVDQGFYRDWVGVAIYARHSYLNRIESEAYAKLRGICDLLKHFKAEVLPTIWPINKTMLKKGASK